MVCAPKRKKRHNRKKGVNTAFYSKNHLYFQKASVANNLGLSYNNYENGN